MNTVARRKMSIFDFGTSFAGLSPDFDETGWALTMTGR
jgi:hypothetical protein